MRAGRSRGWLGAAGLAGFLLLLELAPRVGLVPERYLPPASRIARALAGELGRPGFWTALGDTLAGWAIGLAVAVAASSGLGFTIVQFQRSFAIPEMWSGILLLGLLGVALSLAFRAFEHRVLFWYHGLRRAQRGPS